MKRMNMLMVALLIATVSFAKDIKTVVFNTAPEMHCGGCENRIKNGLKFEKGVKDIKTDLDTKTVTIEYDADKTSTDKLVAAFAKIDYTATEVVAGNKAAAKKGGCCCSGKSAEAVTTASEAPKGGCCGGKKAETVEASAPKSGCGCGAKKAAESVEAVSESPAKKGGCGCGSKKAEAATL